MKIVLNIARLIVGVLFIFSGLVKANDPLGLSYKMQEFFEVWNMHFLNDFTLAFSVLMIAFEIIAGVAVLLGWKMNMFSWLLLLLIIFFTFLTGYALLSGKIRECGCFGDCIPLQANQSFMKDLLLLALILFLFPYRHEIKPVFNGTVSLILLVLTTIFSFVFQWYVLKHLPVVDCLPYKIGNNLPEKMRPSPGAIKDSTVIVFTYKKDGKELNFNGDNLPEDFDDSYEFVKREDKVLRKGKSDAAIRDFILQTPDGFDTTFVLLNEPGYKLFLFLKDGYERGPWVEKIAGLKAKAAEKNITMFLVTNLSDVPELKGALPYLRSDGTAIKTAARHNPTIFLLNAGTVVNKWSAPDFDEIYEAIGRLNP